MTDSIEVRPENVAVETVTEEERKAAQEASLEIESLLDSIHAQSTGLESNYARLGSLLLRIRNERYWLQWGHHSFGAYLKSIRGRLGTGRTQLYQVISVAETLLPLVGEADLAEIGKSKAIELRRIVTATGKRPSDELIAQAKNPDTTLETIRALAFGEMHGEPPPNGTYYTLGGIYVSPEERDEIKRAIDVAKRTDPVVPNDLPEWAQTKEVLLRFAREYYSTYLPETSNQ